MKKKFISVTIFSLAILFITACAFVPTLTGSGGKEPSDNRAPSATFPSNVVVSGAGVTTINGTYKPTATIYNGKTVYLHSSGNYYIFYCSCFWGWKIYNSTGNTNYFRVKSTQDIPPSGLWHQGCAGWWGGYNIPWVESYEVSGNLWVNGTASSPPYEFYDPDMNAEGNSVYKWYRCVTDNATDDGVEIAGANSKTYVAVGADLDRYLRFEVTPVDRWGKIGTSAKTRHSLIITDTPPSAYEVSGAGSSGANGTYILEGSFNARPMYINTSTGYYIYFGGRCGRWSINDELGGMYAFYRAGSSPFPSTAGWNTCCEGDDPPPTVTQL